MNIDDIFQSGSAGIVEGRARSAEMPLISFQKLSLKCVHCSHCRDNGSDQYQEK